MEHCQETSKEIIGHREKKHIKIDNPRGLAEDKRKKKHQAKTARNKIRTTQGPTEKSI